jgi:hypothetical protein
MSEGDDDQLEAGIRKWVVILGSVILLGLGYCAIKDNRKFQHPNQWITRFSFPSVLLTYFL